MTPVTDLSAAGDRRRFLLAAVIAAVSTACCVATIPLTAALGDKTLGAAEPSDVVLGIAWPVIGAAVVRARPRNPVGWLMLVPALVGPYQLAALYAAHTDGQGWLGAVAAWVAIWGFAPPYFFTLPVIPQLFPDGRPLSPRWRRVVVAVLVVAVLTTLARMVSDVHADLAPQVMNPLGIQGADWPKYATLVGSALLFLVGIPLAVVSLFLRMRRARDVERTQLQWLFLGGIVLVVGILFVFGGWR